MEPMDYGTIAICWVQPKASAKMTYKSHEGFVGHILKKRHLYPTHEILWVPNLLKTSSVPNHSE